MDILLVYLNRDYVINTSSDVFFCYSKYQVELFFIQEYNKPL